MPHGVPQEGPDSVGLGEGGWACHMGCHRKGQIVWGWEREAGLATWGATGTASSEREKGLKKHATANTDLLNTAKSLPHRVLVLPSGCDNNVKEEARKLDAIGGGYGSRLPREESL